MRFYLGHRLPGGFWGGVGMGSYRRRARVLPRRRAPRRARVVTRGTAVVVHLTGAEYAALQQREREATARGCGVALLVTGVVIALGLVIEYWFVALPVLGVAVGALANVRRRHRCGVTASRPTPRLH